MSSFYDKLYEFRLFELFDNFKGQFQCMNIVQWKGTSKILIKICFDTYLT